MIWLRLLLIKPVDKSNHSVRRTLWSYIGFYGTCIFDCVNRPGQRAVYYNASLKAQVNPNELVNLLQFLSVQGLTFKLIHSFDTDTQMNCN